MSIAIEHETENQLPDRYEVINGEVVEAVDVFVGGRTGPDPKPALKILEDVPCNKLASVLEGLVPYHTRAKRHKTGRGKAVSRRRRELPRPSSKVAARKVMGVGPSAAFANWVDATTMKRATVIV